MKDKTKTIIIYTLSVIAVVANIYAISTTEVGAAILSVIAKVLGILWLIAAIIIALIAIRIAIYENKSLVIMTAIRRYRMDAIADGKHPDIEYADMEGIWSSIGRWWDWRFNYILPPDKYELIRPYVEYDKIFNKGD